MTSACAHPGSKARCTMIFPQLKQWTRSVREICLSRDFLCRIASAAFPATKIIPESHSGSHGGLETEQATACRARAMRKPLPVVLT